MDENKRMIEYLNETAQIVETTDGKTISAAQMLERFLFPSTFTWNTDSKTFRWGKTKIIFIENINARTECSFVG